LKGAAPLAAQRVNVRLEHHHKVSAVEFLNRRDDRLALRRTADKFHVLGGTPFVISPYRYQKGDTPVSPASAPNEASLWH
jgi:hypothetical protein